MDQELLGDRRRAQEEEYFQRQEQALIAQLQQRREKEATRGRLAERAGVADPQILLELEMLGYTPETVRLLHLVPLLQVAWADGSVSEAERALIVEAARARGIEADSVAHTQLADWLASRPSPDLFEGTLVAIRAMLQAHPMAERESARQDVLSACTAVASASGLLGFGKVSREERKVLARITREIEEPQSADTRPAPGPRPP